MSKIIDDLLRVWRLIGHDLTHLPLCTHKVSYAVSVLNVCRNYQAAGFRMVLTDFAKLCTP
ncbi:hypothetical protein PMI26_05710 [Pseudomonas sp. GM33]|nr:hypothetical protein PMI26_05710 [Pseudomonas sp. GM33]